MTETPTAGSNRHPESCFNLIDFCPNYRRRPQAWFLIPKYQTLSDLFEQINKWLESHPEWIVVSVESIIYDPDSGFGNEISVSIGSLAKKGIKGIRLWLTPNKNGQPFQKLGLINVVPKLNGNNINGSNGRTVWSPNGHETIEEMVIRVNNLLHKKPIQGKIISVETVSIPVTGKWEIDTESSEFYRDSSSFAQTLRIYYEYGETCMEEIGLKDFVPSSSSWDSPLAPPDYESFASLFTRASQWFRDQPSHYRYLNCQSVEVPLMSKTNSDCKHPIDSNLSLLIPGKAEFSLKFIRLAYAVPTRGISVESIKHPEIVLNCKIFVPIRHKTSNQYETVAATKRKMEAWLTITGARVLSAETTFLKLSYCNSSIAANVDSCLTSLCNRPNDSHHIVTYRVYLDGHYVEPPTRLLPSFDNELSNDESNCCIS
ncbi:uncharacterized protein LOC107360101 isoform X2 [Tetranychus urticae]|uniref:uncharacterized protein LOC107360101 isoform X2 n=1 Tax=Tetranychus urticae TaxID=32264 RepID=UPI00077BBE34|nr:uncharacterized protein LOC107360101 isoform X2 [Tetranychus urticae]